MVFPVVMYGCESWTIKKASSEELMLFNLRCWRILLRVPWTARSIQSILKEISPGCLLEAWCWSWSANIWPPDANSWLIAKDPGAGKDWGQEEKGMTEDELVGWHHRLNRHELGRLGCWWWTGMTGVLWFLGLQRVGHDWATAKSCLARKYIMLTIFYLRVISGI